MAKKKVLVIGGEPSGMMTAIMAAKNGAKVTLLEKNTKIGKKLLVTGNGRCNVTNRRMEEKFFHSSTKPLFPYIDSQFTKEDVIDFLWSIGIETVELEKGKIYPKSLESSSIVKALLVEAKRLGVQIIYNVNIQNIEYKQKFVVVTKEKSYYGDCLVIATGGKSYADSGSTGEGYLYAKQFGHKITTLTPSIVQLHGTFPYFSAVKGAKINGTASLLTNGKGITSVTDEVLFTEYGLSGPGILQISSYITDAFDKGNYEVEINFFPTYTRESFDEKLRERFSNFPYMTAMEVFNGFLHKRFIPPVLKLSQIPQEEKAGNITKEMRKNLVKNLMALKIPITGFHLWNQAQCTKGGVDCREVNPKTLQSQKKEGLYFVGEVLDIDGDCGGYNLQWAFASGAVVGKEVACL